MHPGRAARARIACLRSTGPSVLAKTTDAGRSISGQGARIVGGVGRNLAVRTPRRAPTHIIAHSLYRARADTALRASLEETTRLKARLETENVYLREEILGSHDFGEIVGKSAAMRQMLDLVAQVAATDSSVLLLGETGTGKELLARAIHDRSRRRGLPLVKINCAAIPSSLIESELFGHEKGAFTGAVTTEPGRFEVANRGTIFLDEIGELGPDAQAKLLRVLQEGEIDRVGSTRTRTVDVRVIAATNRNLEAAMAEDAFERTCSTV
jgi:formate hydrogenlyase transcriptional activator